MVVIYCWTIIFSEGNESGQRTGEGLTSRKCYLHGKQVAFNTSTVATRLIQIWLFAHTFDEYMVNLSLLFWTMIICIFYCRLLNFEISIKAGFLTTQRFFHHTWFYAVFRMGEDTLLHQGTRCPGISLSLQLPKRNKPSWYLFFLFRQRSISLIWFFFFYRLPKHIF